MSDDAKRADDLQQRTLRAFTENGRIKTIPAKLSRRIIIARWLSQQFSPDVEYTEREVNDIVKRHHEDFATLRREMVDHGLLERKDGVYRRVRR